MTSEGVDGAFGKLPVTLFVISKNKKRTPEL